MFCGKSCPNLVYIDVMHFVLSLALTIKQKTDFEDRLTSVLVFVKLSQPQTINTNDEHSYV